MGEILKEKNGHMKFINTNPLQIIDDLRDSVEWLTERYEKSKEIINMMKKDVYKDEEMTRLKNEVKRLEEEMLHGYYISKDEWDKIQKWQEDWFQRKRNGNTYMGAIGGGFTYQFHPTSIGIVASVIAPDGDKFEFRNDL